MSGTRLVFCFVLLVLVTCVYCGDSKQKYKPKRVPKREDDGKWKKKSVLDYSDNDVDKLYDQWEEEEEEVPADELQPWEREPPPIDMTKINLQDKDSLIKEGKKDRVLMMFAMVAGNPTRADTERISHFWEQSLYNAHIQLKRYVVEDNKILIQIDNGAEAVQIRDFLVKQEDCLEVTVEQQTYDGLGKKLAEKNKPLTKEEAKEKKEKEAKKKAEREKTKEENKKKKEAEKKAKEGKDKEEL